MNAFPFKSRTIIWFRVPTRHSCLGSLSYGLLQQSSRFFIYSLPSSHFGPILTQSILPPPRHTSRHRVNCMRIFGKFNSFLKVSLRHFFACALSSGMVGGCSGESSVSSSRDGDGIVSGSFHQQSSSFSSPFRLPSSFL